MQILPVKNEGVKIKIHVQPRAKKTEVVGLYGDALKIRIAEPPVEGAANEACEKYMASILHLPLSEVVVTGGKKSRTKSVFVKGLTVEKVRSILQEIVNLT